MVDTKCRDIDARLASIAEEFSRTRAALVHHAAENETLRKAMAQLCRALHESLRQSRRRINEIANRDKVRTGRSKSAHRRNGVGLAPTRLRKVLEYIDASLAERLDVATLASVAGMSPSHFAVMFKQSTGLPPHEAVMRRRLARARQLLADESRTIASIGSQLGFSSQAHFATVFRRRIGVPPNVWRAEFRRASTAAHNQSWKSLISTDAESRPQKSESQRRPVRALMEAVTEAPHHADTGASHPGTA
jgi:AraC-like DNA-binding protein